MAEMVSSLLIIGTKVSSKKTGFPGVGYIVGVLTPNLYCGWNRMTITDAIDSLGRWTEIYPNWYKDPVVVVFYETPRKTVTLEEAKKFGASYEDWDNYPMSQYIAYPIDDLTPFEVEEKIEEVVTKE